MKVSVDKSVFDKYPDVLEYIVVVKGVNNRTKHSRKILQLLKAQEKELQEEMGGKNVKELPAYKAWIDTYKDVLSNTSAKKSFRKSVIPAHVALAKRVTSGKSLPNINPLVNYYNYISLKHKIPYGGEDLATYVGDVALRFTDGSEKYLGIGETNVDDVHKGEVAWIDEHSVTCRMWGWRQSDRTKVVDTTTDVLFYIDVIKDKSGISQEQATGMVQEFMDGLTEYFGATCDMYILGMDNNEVKIDYESKSLREIYDDVEYPGYYSLKPDIKTLSLSPKVKDLGIRSPVAAVIEGVTPVKQSRHVDSFVIDQWDKIKDLDIDEVDNNEIVLEYNRLLKNFGYDKLETAVVNLLKLSKEKGRLPRRSPVVDVYNAVSAENMISIGAHDADLISDNLRLETNKQENLEILPVGVDDVESINVGDLVLRDDNTIFSWVDAKDADNAKLTKNSKNLFFIVIGNKNVSQEYAAKALKTVCSTIAKSCGGRWAVYDAVTGKDIHSGGNVYIPEEGNKGTKGIRKRKPESMGFVDSNHLGVKLEQIIGGTLRGGGVEFGLNLTESRDLKFGDYTSTIALQQAKIQSRSPREIAGEIVTTLSNSDELGKILNEITVAPNGFINFRVKSDYLLKELVDAIKEGEEFGSSNVGNGKSIVVESPGWNPNKTPHVGHILNMFLGQTLLRMFSKVGFEAINDDINNDKGLPVMQSLWAYMNFGEGATPASEGVKPDHFVHKYYSLGRSKYDSDESAKNEIDEVLRKWEAGDEEIHKVWEMLVGWAYDGQDMVFDKYGEKYDAHRWLESEVYKGGKEIVMSHLGGGVIEQLPDGAVIARIEQEYGLPDTIVVKSDGTGLYHTQDINLTLQKKKMFNPWKIIWIVAEEQIAHFQRLFAILDALDVMPIDNLYHFPYGWVLGKDGGKLSSRDGADLSADELHSNLVDAAKKVIQERGTGEGLDVDEVAQAVAVAAVKMAYLDGDPFKNIKFDMESAMSFTGRSGPYLMYAYTRARNVIKKVGEVDDLDIGTLSESMGDLDRELLLKALQYPKIVLDATNNYYPGLIANYLYELAKLFSNFYENVNVMNSTQQEKVLRVGILELVSHVLKDGLGVLGIGVLEEM